MICICTLLLSFWVFDLNNLCIKFHVYEHTWYTCSSNTSQQVRDALKIRIDCNGDRQVWTQVLDRKDGCFIVRYKLFQSCNTGFRIIVTFQKKHLGKSPYKIQGFTHNFLHVNCMNYQDISKK